MNTVPPLRDSLRPPLCPPPRHPPGHPRLGWGRLLALLVALVCLLPLTGCDADRNADRERGPLWADPGQIHLSPRRTFVEVEIHNRSGTARPIREISLGGEDWDTLRIRADQLPRTIPAHDSILIPLEISAAAFRLEPGLYRSGQAELSFASSAYTYVVPIEFVGPQDRPRLAGTAVALLALALLFTALVWAGLRRGPAPRDPPPNETAPAGPLAALATRIGPRSWTGMVYLIFLGSALATIPVGLGLCSARLGVAVGPHELAQCRAALGGAPLLALDASPAISWTLSTLALASVSWSVLVTRAHGPRVAAPSLALAGLRLITACILLAALGFGLDPEGSSLTDIVLVQTRSSAIASLQLPRWGVFAQPLGFALALALLVLTRGSEPLAHPSLRVLARLDDLVWTALVTTVYLGGPALPGLSQRPVPLLPHAAQISIELLTFAAKLALLFTLVNWLRAQVEPELKGAGDSQRIQQLARTIIPLALVQLVAILIWRAI